MNSTLLTEATKLTLVERIELVEAIWDSVAAEVEALPLSEEHRLELDRRLADLLRQCDQRDARLADLAAEPDAGSPWAEVRARLERGR